MTTTAPTWFPSKARHRARTTQATGLRNLRARLLLGKHVDEEAEEARERNDG